MHTLDSIGNIIWQNDIGGSLLDQLTCMQETVDGGFVVGGFSDSNISGDKSENCLIGIDYWILKLDSSGNIQWQNTIGGSEGDPLYSIQQTADHCYILGGSSASPSSSDKLEDKVSNVDYWVVKLDEFGNIQWQNAIGGWGGTDYLRSIHQTMDGGYFLGGYSNSSLANDKTEDVCGSYDYWVMKLDPAGNILWQNVIGGLSSLAYGTDQLYDADGTSDKGYVLAGKSTSQSSCDKTSGSLGDYDYWIVRLYPDVNLAAPQIDFMVNASNICSEACISFTDLSSNSPTQWSWSFEGAVPNSSLAQNPANICYPATGNYKVTLIASNDYGSSSLTIDTFITVNNFYCSTAPTIQWQNTIGSSKGDLLNSVDKTQDGGYIVGGTSYSVSANGDKIEDGEGENDYWVVKLDSILEIEWQNVIGGDSDDYLSSCYVTQDGGYILGGWSESESRVWRKD